MKDCNRLIFLDYDGCLTSKSEGNYFNPRPAEYKMSEKIAESLQNFCLKMDAKIVLTTNWRKFEEDGVYKCPLGEFHNPIKEIKERFRSLIVASLPAVRHVRKAQALILWFEETGYDGEYVIFDDDLSEDYQTTSDHGIRDHFILVDNEFGISAEDLDKAEKTLKGKCDEV